MIQITLDSAYLKWNLYCDIVNVGYCDVENVGYCGVANVGLLNIEMVPADKLNVDVTHELK